MSVDGPIWIEPPARGAAVSKLRLTSLDEKYRIPLKVQADDARITHNRITGATNTNITCVLVGSARVTRATVIENNTISRCGTTGKFDHLIYLERTRNARVRHNVLTGNPGGWGIHLYPDADRTLIEHNTIDGNLGGVIFAGDGEGKTSDRNVVRGNLISFSRKRWNIEGSWGDGPRGTGNTAHDNCVYSRGAGAPSGIAARDGFRAERNTVSQAPRAGCGRAGAGR